MHLEERLLKQIVRARGVARELGEIRLQIRRQRVVQAVEGLDASGLILSHQDAQCRILGRRLLWVRHESAGTRARAQRICDASQHRSQQVRHLDEHRPAAAPEAGAAAPL